MAAFLSLSNVSVDSLVLLSFSILFIHFSFALPNLHSENDAQASLLLRLKSNFVFDNFKCDLSTDYTKLSSWKIEADLCSWDGVHCDNQTGHIIGLDLSNSCILGSINSASPLFQLVHLKTLDLSFNNFNLSKIPGGIRSLSKLTHLNLKSSNFTGQIPSETLYLSCLVSLDLSLNSFVLHKPSLKDVVETFTRLTELRLVDVNISSHVPRGMSNLTSLSSLLLENCSLLGEFPSNILRLPNLRIFSMWHNPNLSGYLPEFHAGSPLEELWLDGTNISGQIPVSIGNLKSLRIFSAWGSSFGGIIPSSIGNLTKLNTLDLRDNDFHGRIPSSMGNLFQLTYLGLSGHKFISCSSSTLHWLSRLSKLETLDLSDINLFGFIPYSLQNLTQLGGLWLNTNQLTGPIPSWLGNFTKLTYLHITRNQLQGSIPNSIFELQNIQAIGLHHNNLRGSLRFDSFLQSKSLSLLQLSGNQLSLVGTSYANTTLPKFQFLGFGECNLSEFPSFLRGQHQLQALILDHNNIQGYVPSWIFNLKRLGVLDLNNNFLTSFKHSSALFCNLTSLLMLDMSNNDLTGNLPPCLANFANSALYINLRNNSLTGKIPDSFPSGCALKVIDLSSNRIEGEVPKSLSKCSFLEILNLEKNRMNDVFPSWLGTLPHLRVLSFKSNKFHGEIGQPLSELEFNQLQIIDLSDNCFSGMLPLEYFRNWVAMKSVDHDNLAYMEASTKFYVGDYQWTIFYPYFIRIVNKGTQRAYEKILEFFVVVDLSSNMFEGEIPEITGTLKALKSLNLSNNILTGRIPSSLGDLQDLEALDLSLNTLSGQIPIQLTLLTFLSFFNVSHNNLTGSVPWGKQFATFENDSFAANPGLCGPPLSNTCEKKAGTLPLPPLADEDEDSPLEFGWEIVLIGCGSGFVIGVAFGCAKDTRKYERLIKKFVRRL